VAAASRTKPLPSCSGQWNSAEILPEQAVPVQAAACLHPRAIFTTD